MSRSYESTPIELSSSLMLCLLAYRVLSGVPIRDLRSVSRLPTYLISHSQVPKKVDAVLSGRDTSATSRYGSPSCCCWQRWRLATAAHTGIRVCCTCCHTCCSRLLNSIQLRQSRRRRKQHQQRRGKHALHPSQLSLPVQHAAMAPLLPATSGIEC